MPTGSRRGRTSSTRSSSATATATGCTFPTIEAASEGGYGADPGVSLAELGAGERMMDKALLNIYLLQGKFARERRSN